MILDDMIQKAKAGDVNMMMSLGNYYAKLNTGDGITSAEEWYQKAAETNHTQAAYLATACKRPLAAAEVALVDDYSLSVHALRDVYLWAKRTEALYLSDATGSDKVTIKDILKLVEDASYDLAYAMLMLKNYKAVHNLLIDQPGDRCAILLALSNYMLAETSQDFYRVYRDLEIIKTNEEYVAKKKSTEESKVLYLAAIALSTLERGGHDCANLSPDPDAAARTLLHVFNVTSDPTVRKCLQQELNNYKKGIFGKYKYIGD